jgi:hypothetical protein
MFTVKTNMLITWEHFHREKFALRSNKSETYLRIWADLLRNFGLGAGLICDRRQCSYAQELAVLHLLQPRSGGM